MITIKIENISYTIFTMIRDEIMRVAPWAVIQDSYSNSTQTMYMQFWDSRYIPAELKPFAIVPPGDLDYQMDEILRLLESEL